MLKLHCATINDSCQGLLGRRFFICSFYERCIKCHGTISSCDNNVIALQFPFELNLQATHFYHYCDVETVKEKNQINHRSRHWIRKSCSSFIGLWFGQIQSIVCSFGSPIKGRMWRPGSMQKKFSRMWSGLEGIYYHSFLVSGTMAQLVDLLSHSTRNLVRSWLCAICVGFVLSLKA